MRARRAELPPPPPPIARAAAPAAAPRFTKHRSQCSSAAAPKTAAHLAPASISGRPLSLRPCSARSQWSRTAAHAATLTRAARRSRSSDLCEHVCLCDPQHVVFVKVRPRATDPRISGARLDLVLACPRVSCGPTPQDRSQSLPSFDRKNACLAGLAGQKGRKKRLRRGKVQIIGGNVRFPLFYMFDDIS